MREIHYIILFMFSLVKVPNHIMVWLRILQSFPKVYHLKSPVREQRCQGVCGKQLCVC